MNQQAVGLLRELLRRDLDVRWRGSALGAGWAVVQPLGWMVLYLLVFNVVLRIPAPPGGERFGFGIYLLSGLLPFLALQEGVSRSASVWHENSSLIKKMRVRPSIFILTVCLSACVLEIHAASVMPPPLGVPGRAPGRTCA